MNRSAAFRREMRNKRIKERQRKIKDLKSFYSKEFETSYIYGKKIYSAVFGDTGGYLSKGYYGAIFSPRKTKTKNAYASHRHKGGYGKAILYSRHDQSQIMHMDLALKEYYENTGGNEF